MRAEFFNDEILSCFELCILLIRLIFSLLLKQIKDYFKRKPFLMYDISLCAASMPQYFLLISRFTFFRCPEDMEMFGTFS